MKPGFFINKNAPDCVGGIFVDMGVWKRKIILTARRWEYASLTIKK